jgi:hypothetical protein
VRVPAIRSAALPALLALVLLAGCGGDDDGSDSGSDAPAASAFPEPPQRLEELLADHAGGDQLVVSPAGSVFSEGRNRLGFAVFTLDRTQVTDADVAIYAAHGATGEVEGPYPARVESLETDAAFTAQTTANDPDAAKVVYVSELQLDQPGEWRLVALVQQPGEDPVAVRMPSVAVRQGDPIPDVGEKAPVIHTPTTEDVGNVSEIDTRVPPDDMHNVDFADVVGEKPVVLMFATPALCQSRVCGPVVDVAEQVKRDAGDDAAFIHMEIYDDNDVNKGLRPQVRAYHLPTEPWTFVIDADGRISSRIEGALSVGELEDALDRATASGA